ncbi:MAG: metal ABC transporter permease [Zavarzinella sp.]
MFAATSPLLEQIGEPFGMSGFQIGAFVAVGLICIICGLIGPFVVGNRMAFFSDAMAHCTFAGVSLGILITLAVGLSPGSKEMQWLVPLIMASFGALIGVGIAYVRETTGLSSDTVIGVFFAGALGFGSMLLKAIQDRNVFDPERFLFGGPILVNWFDILNLVLLFVLVLIILAWKTNDFLQIAVHSSLARSRGVRVTWSNYLFIVLLALIVNFSISAVGVLLINAMLIVPAATASNITLNLRQMFRYSIIFSIGSGFVGLLLSFYRFQIPGFKRSLEFGASGTIICISVGLFALSMVIRSLKQKLVKTN